ncbi:MAG: hypothetical protein GY935_12675, partial [Gammaproteobacteria bacterium]|nr:hypothetical protein [Gammaproteobacteria bacterium]
ALWSDTSDGSSYNINTSYYTAGTGWATAQILRSGALADDSVNPSVNAHLAMNANGEAVAVWAEGPSPASAWASVYSSGIWGAATLLESSLESAGAPAVAIGSAGNAMAVFAQFDGSRYVIHANRFSAGLWSADELIGTTDTGSINGDAAIPEIVVDGAGNLVAVWQQSDGLQSNIWANKFDTDSAAWELPLIIDTENLGDADSVQVAVNTGGDAIVVWQQSDGIATDIQSNAYEVNNTGVPNIVPVPVTTLGLTVDEHTLVTLDGSASFDQDGSVTNYSWSQISGTAVTLDTSTTATSGVASFVAPALILSETLVFRLTVTDDNSETSAIDASVMVNPVNDAPVGLPVIAGIATQGVNLSVDTTGISDADGLGAFSYQWQADGVDIAAASSASYALTQAEVGSNISVTVSY